MTLQFNDNSQLKVHRLVLSACTDYFNLLEQQCEMVDDILIMPDDLQADVIVPIVNFMYTGTLEFQYSMFDKLLKTANDMNMTVLLKLLEAHRSATRNIQKSKPAPVVLNKQAPRVIMPQSYNASKSRTLQVSPQMVRTIVKQEPKQATQKVLYKHHQTTIKPLVGGKSLPEPVAVIAKYSHQTANIKGPTRFEMDENIEGFEGQFDAISYESKPLLTAEQIKKDEESSLFEKLKKDVHLKRPSASTLQQPAVKKLNLDDVKELSENIRLRKQLAADTDDVEDDPDEYYEDTTFDEEEEEQVSVQKPPQGQIKTYTASSTAVVKPGTKTSPKTTISIKEDSGNLNHAKIIGEVLKKYPHLVKNNKNIKLKILQKSPGTEKATPPTAKVYPTKISTTATSTPATVPSNPKLVQKIAPQLKQTQNNPQRPKRIDAKTMHELIAKGAENMTGPWLCLKCGIDGRPISIPSYKSFRNHLIAVHKEKIDARLCEDCGHRSQNRLELQYHQLMQHDTQPPKDVKFPTCTTCGFVAQTQIILQKHSQDEHGKVEPMPVKTIQQCSYCEKVFLKETTLTTHIKTYHREQAILDGVIEETFVSSNQSSNTNANSSSNLNDKGIKILSSISLPPTKNLPIVFTTATSQQSSVQPSPPTPPQMIVQAQKLEPSSEAEALSNVASGIATSLTLVGTTAHMDDQYIIPHADNTDNFLTSNDSEARIVTADGSELQLTSAQKEEILSQLQGNDGTGNVIMVLNHESYSTATANVQSAEENQHHQQQQQSNQPIMVCNIMEPTSTTTTTTSFDETSMMNAVEEPVPEVEKVTEEKHTEDAIKTDEAAEKAKQSLISTLQGDWTDDESEDAHDGHDVSDDNNTKNLGAPALFEDISKKENETSSTSLQTDKDDDDPDTKIADAVDDLLSELEGEFREKEKKAQQPIGLPIEKTLITLDEVKGDNEDDDLEKDEKPETAAAAEKEICRLVDEWDDDL